MSAPPASVRLVLSDLAGRLYWTWSWDGGEPRVAVTPQANLAGAARLLAQALPGPAPDHVVEADGAEIPASVLALSGLTACGEMLEGSDETGKQLTAGARQLARSRRLGQALMSHRCLTGPLAAPKTAARWAQELADLLLPETLLGELREHLADEVPLELGLMSSGVCSAVPWEILPVAGDTVLLEIAEIVHLAPLTRRDDEGVSPNQWEENRQRPALWVVDPLLRGNPRLHVLDTESHRAWSERLAESHGLARVAMAYDRKELSGDLLEKREQAALTSGVSRLFYLGHVVSRADDAESAAMLLGCDRSSYGTAEVAAGIRGFSARDALVGTVDFDDVIGSGVGVRRFPDAALGPDRKPREVPGIQLWPMPSRVALIACNSGADFSHAEPFGLVTAFFEAGAALVTASRWTLLTDRVFACYPGAGQGRRPVHEAAQAVDEAHGAQDPVAELSAWQRRRLHAWREHGDLADSPLTWASLATYVWHRRNKPLPDGLAGLIGQETAHA